MVKLYTVDQVAVLLRCPRETVYHLVAADGIPHMRVGRLIRFDAEHVERWIKGQSARSPSLAP